MRTRLFVGMTAAVLATAVLPQAVLAGGDEDRARAAVAAAQAKIDTNEKQGISADAADLQARARAALEEAQKQIKDDDEDHAWHAAREAIALADLATATAELKKLTAERERLAAR